MLKFELGLWVLFYYCAGMARKCNYNIFFPSLVIMYEKSSRGNYSLWKFFGILKITDSILMRITGAIWKHIISLMLWINFISTMRAIKMDPERNIINIVHKIQNCHIKGLTIIEISVLSYILLRPTMSICEFIFSSIMLILKILQPSKRIQQVDSA